MAPGIVDNHLQKVDNHIPEDNHGDWNAQEPCYSISHYSLFSSLYEDVPLSLFFDSFDYCLCGTADSPVYEMSSAPAS